MISRPTNYDAINENGGSRKLPMGAYVAIIRRVTDDTEKQFAEGEYKGIGVDTYEAWGKWSHSFRVYYSEKAMWRLKKFITRVEKTNNGFQFDWANPNCLVNKGIGLVIGYRQYYSSKDGSLKEALDVQDFVTAADVREGNIPNDPKVVEPKSPPPVAKVEDVSEQYDESQLPF